MAETAPPTLSMTPTEEGAIVKTPWYQIELQRAPAGIKTLAWDPAGASQYRLVAGGDDAGTSAAATLFARTLDPHPAVAARAFVDISQRPRFPFDITLRKIPLLGGLSAEWRFRFRPDSFEYEITWIADRDFIDIVELGHGWCSPLPLTIDGDTTVTEEQTTAEFGPSLAVAGDGVTLRVSQVLNSTPFQAARRAGPSGFAWLNLRSAAEPSILRVGGRRGGQWVVRGEARN